MSVDGWPTLRGSQIMETGGNGSPRIFRATSAVGNNASVAALKSAEVVRNRLQFGVGQIAQETHAASVPVDVVTDIA